MKTKYFTTSLLAGYFFLVQPILAGEDPSAVDLNTSGVKALNQIDYEAAIEKFEAALRIDPNYKLARHNLAISFNNYGLQLRNKNPEQSIKYFHAGLSNNPNNPTIRDNLESSIRAIGLNPRLFEDRVQLGNKASKEKDYAGATIEYEAALSIKNSSDIQKLLEKAKAALVQTQPTATGQNTPAADVSKEDVDFGPYMSVVQRRIKSAYHYSGMTSSWHRPPTVTFKIHKDGTISDLRLTYSCGVPEADKGLSKAVQDAAPFPPLPPNAKASVDISFQWNSCPTFGGHSWQRRF